MKEIPLTQGKVALVDDEDYEKLIKCKWWAAKDCCTYYAKATLQANNIKSTISMHRVVMGLGSGDSQKIDHRNNNGLDNRKSNLRLCSDGENARNRKPYIGKSSPYKGVTWHKRIEKWQTRIGFEGKQIHLGYFEEEIEAAIAYNKAAFKHFKSFSYLNIIPEMIL